MYGPNPFLNLTDNGYNDIQSFQRIKADSEESRYKQLFHTKDETWSLDYFTDDNAKTFPLHLHDYLEVILFLQGSIDYLVESKIYHICPTDIILIPPGFFHQPQIINSQAMYERIVIWITNEALEALSTPDADLMHCVRYLSEKQHFLVPDQTPENLPMRTAMQQLACLQRENCYGKKVLTMCFLREIILCAYQSMQSAQLPPQRIMKNPLIAAAVDHILHHLSEPITLESLADTLYVSKYHLAHTFKKHMGVSLHQYLINKRLTLAKKLIAQGHSFNSACTECGFNNYSNFFKVFKTNVGLSPREYRESLSANHSRSEMPEEIGSDMLFGVIC